MSIRGPLELISLDAKTRSMIDLLIRELTASANIEAVTPLANAYNSSSAPSATGSNPSEGDSATDQPADAAAAAAKTADTFASLTKDLNFTKLEADRAIEACQGEGLQQALDWLCLNLKPAELERGFVVLPKQPAAKGSTRAPARQQNAPDVYLPVVTQFDWPRESRRYRFLRMGFATEQITGVETLLEPFLAAQPLECLLQLGRVMLTCAAVRSVGSDGLDTMDAARAHEWLHSVKLDCKHAPAKLFQPVVAGRTTQQLEAAQEAAQMTEEELFAVGSIFEENVLVDLMPTDAVLLADHDRDHPAADPASVALPWRSRFRIVVYIDVPSAILPPNGAGAADDGAADRVWLTCVIPIQSLYPTDGAIFALLDLPSHHTLSVVEAAGITAQLALQCSQLRGMWCA